jgi:nitrite reductase/ring-hydroxylating ferredoxin subunit
MRTDARARFALCRLAEIPDRTARGFVVETGAPGYPQPLDLFAHRDGESVVAYRNSCPHQGTPLELVPDGFLTRDRKRFLCTTHGAQFRLHDGLCTTGPCKGKSLTALVIERDGEDLLLHLPD